MRFEEAATVFGDPLFVFVQASRNDEAREAAIGFDSMGRLLYVVHIEVQRAAPNPLRSSTMLSDRLKNRLVKDRAMTSITLRIPVDVVETMKKIAPQRGLSGYQTLLKLYLSEGLRRDEAQFTSGKQARLIQALKKHGVSDEVLQAAERESA